MTDNAFQYGESGFNAGGNSANLSLDAWAPVNVVKKEIGRQVAPQFQNEFGKGGGTYSDYAVHDWKVHKQANGAIDSLKEDDGAALAVRSENLGTDNFGNSVLGISYRAEGNKDAEVRMVMHTLPNGQFLGMEDCVVANPQGGAHKAYFRDIVAGSSDDSALKMNMKQLADPSNSEYQFLMSKLTELNQRLGPVQASASGSANLEQMLNNVEKGPYQSAAPMDIPTTSPQIPQYRGNYNTYPVQRQNYSYQGNYQKYPTQDQFINQNRAGGLMNKVINGIGPALRMRNTYDGSLYQHIPVSGGVQRPSIYQGQYQQAPLDGGMTKDVSAILEAKRQRLIREGRLPAQQQQQNYESGQSSSTKTDVYGRLENR